MKQTVEEAARIEREKVVQELHVAYKMHKDPKHYIISNAAIQKYAVPLFKAGAEWQAKQSSWISVEDKAGCDTSGDCIVMVMNSDIFKAYFSSENKWMKSNGGYYDEVIDDVVAWFPIPSFEEILEANKDVLERIKEKGD